MSPEERAFAIALTTAIADDIRARSPAGALVRVVLRWYMPSDPLYFTVHALGDAEPVDASLAWYPQEWANADAEFERSDRIESIAEVQRTGKALEAHYEQFEPPDLEDPNVPSPAILAVARMLPDALSALPRAAHFAVAAQHFEGWGAEYSLKTLGSPQLLALLKARDEWPPSDEAE